MFSEPYHTLRSFNSFGGIHVHVRILASFLEPYHTLRTCLIHFATPGFGSFGFCSGLAQRLANLREYHQLHLLLPDTEPSAPEDINTYYGDDSNAHGLLAELIPRVPLKPFSSNACLFSPGPMPWLMIEPSGTITDTSGTRSKKKTRILLGGGCPIGTTNPLLAAGEFFAIDRAEFSRVHKLNVGNEPLIPTAALTAFTARK